tara:strand:- start:2936 stop:3904 length:969 start_codon:yes stop_codon:yes gene_type:complete
MDLIDSKYIGLVSARLDKFKKVKNNLYNFRCPLCGDSQKQKNKARGYFYQVKVNTNYKCHNCGASMSLNNFLKKLDGVLHGKYTMEKFKKGFTGKNFPVEEPKLEFEKPVFKTKIDLPLCSEVVQGRTYCETRALEPSQFYYAEKFCEFVNSLKVTFDSFVQEEPRIIIPLFYNKELVGLQGRSIRSSLLKYITIMLDDEAPKIYGLDNIRRDAPVFVTEGPFDSSFVRNSIAMCGADGDVRKWGVSDPIWVYDNEPRNSEIVKRISDTIDRGDKVVIWPSKIWQKDINDMVLYGHKVMDLLESNTYSGLEAKVKFTEWKKI